MDGITGLVITGMALGMAPGMPGIFNARGDYDGGTGVAGTQVWQKNNKIQHLAY